MKWNANELELGRFSRINTEFVGKDFATEFRFRFLQWIGAGFSL